MDTATIADNGASRLINSDFSEETSRRTYPQVLNDAGFINGSIEGINTALSIGTQNLYRRPVKNFGQFLVREGAISKAKRFARPFKQLAKYTPIVNVALGATDFAHAYDYDLRNNDSNRRESTRSFLGTIGNMALGATAVTTVAALGVSTLPATALVIAAGYTGQAVGESLADGYIAFKKWWNG